jgi:hypothetical protein
MVDNVNSSVPEDLIRLTLAKFENLVLVKRKKIENFNNETLVNAHICSTGLTHGASAGAS